VILMLATVGVCLSWGVTALGMRYLAGWEWMSALLFGALIAATDPVSVIATSLLLSVTSFPIPDHWQLITFVSSLDTRPFFPYTTKVQ
jgi:NhaP-type Na+/H+ or K+/H+ antiporter